jgi:uncharacterized protein (DUF305 family)
MSRALRHALACLLLTAAAATGLSACGSDDDDESNGRGAKGNAAEKAFLTAMVAHHESGIDMAEIADERAEHSFVKKLAGEIVAAQTREIAQMKEIHKRLFDGGLRPDHGAHDGLGLTAAQAGMTHSAHTNQTLRSAEPFDRAFVDEMVPHHEGAIAMAKVVLKETRDPELRKLAQGITRAQDREISKMNDFRKREYGGGAPREATPSVHGEHGG